MSNKNFGNEGISDSLLNLSNDYDNLIGGEDFNYEKRNSYFREKEKKSELLDSLNAFDLKTSEEFKNVLYKDSKEDGNDITSDKYKLDYNINVNNFDQELNSGLFKKLDEENKIDHELLDLYFDGKGNMLNVANDNMNKKRSVMSRISKMSFLDDNIDARKELLNLSNYNNKKKQSVASRLSKMSFLNDNFDENKLLLNLNSNNDDKGRMSSARFSKMGLLDEDFLFRDNVDVDEIENKLKNKRESIASVHKLRNSSLFNLSATDENMKDSSMNLNYFDMEKSNASLSKNENLDESDIITTSPLSVKLNKETPGDIINVTNDTKMNQGDRMDNEENKKRNRRKNSIDILDDELNDLKRHYLMDGDEGHDIRNNNDNIDDINDNLLMSEYVSDSEFLKRNSSDKRSIGKNSVHEEVLLTDHSPSRNSVSCWEDKISSTRKVKNSDDILKKGILKQSNSLSDVKESLPLPVNVTGRKKSVQFSHRSVAVFDEKEKISPLHLTQFTRISSDSNKSDIKKKRASEISKHNDNDENVMSDMEFLKDMENSPIDKLLYRSNNGATAGVDNNNTDLIKRSSSVDSVTFKKKRSIDNIEYARLSPLKDDISEANISDVVNGGTAGRKSKGQSGRSVISDNEHYVSRKECTKEINVVGQNYRKSVHAENPEESYEDVLAQKTSKDEEEEMEKDRKVASRKSVIEEKRNETKFRGSVFIDNKDDSPLKIEQLNNLNDDQKNFNKIENDKTASSGRKSVKPIFNTNTNRGSVLDRNTRSSVVGGMRDRRKATQDLNRNNADNDNGELIKKTERNIGGNRRASYNVSGNVTKLNFRRTSVTIGDTKNRDFYYNGKTHEKPEQKKEYVNEIGKCFLKNKNTSQRVANSIADNVPSSIKNAKLYENTRERETIEEEEEEEEEKKKNQEKEYIENEINEFYSTKEIEGLENEQMLTEEKAEEDINNYENNIESDDIKSKELHYNEEEMIEHGAEKRQEQFEDNEEEHKHNEKDMPNEEHYGDMVYYNEHTDLHNNNGDHHYDEKNYQMNGNNENFPETYERYYEENNYEYKKYEHSNHEHEQEMEHKSNKNVYNSNDYHYEENCENLHREAEKHDEHEYMSDKNNDAYYRHHMEKIGEEAEGEIEGKNYYYEEANREYQRGEHYRKHNEEEYPRNEENKYDMLNKPFLDEPYYENRETQHMEDFYKKKEMHDENEEIMKQMPIMEDYNRVYKEEGQNYENEGRREDRGLSYDEMDFYGENEGKIPIERLEKDIELKNEEESRNEKLLRNHKRFLPFAQREETRELSVKELLSEKESKITKGEIKEGKDTKEIEKKTERTGEGEEKKEEEKKEVEIQRKYTRPVKYDKFGKVINEKEELFKHFAWVSIERCRFQSQIIIYEEGINEKTVVKFYENIRNMIFKFVNKVDALNKVSTKLEDAKLKFELPKISSSKTKRAVDALKSYNLKIENKIEQKKKLLEKQKTVLDKKKRKLEALTETLNNKKNKYGDAASREEELNLIKKYNEKVAELQMIETTKGIVVKNINRYGIHYELLNSNYYNFETLYDYRNRGEESVLKERQEEARENSSYKYNRMNTNESNGYRNMIEVREQKNMINNMNHINNSNNNENQIVGNGTFRTDWNHNGIIAKNMNNPEENRINGYNNSMNIKNEGSNENALLVDKNEFVKSDMLKCVDEEHATLIDINELYKKTYHIKNLHLNKKKRHLFLPDITEDDLNNDWPYNITIEVIFSNVPKPMQEVEGFNMNMNNSPLKMKNVKHVVANKMHLMKGGNKGTNIHTQKEENKKYINLFRPYKLMVDAFMHFKEIKITTYYKYINDENMCYHIWNKNYDRDNYAMHIKNVDVSYEMKKIKACNFKIKNIEKYSYYCHNLFLGIEWKLQLEIVKYKLLEVINKRLNKFTYNSIAKSGMNVNERMNGGGNINETYETAKPSKDALKYIVEESEYCFYLLNNILYQYKQLLKYFVNLSNTYFDYYQSMVVFKCIITSDDISRHSFWLFLFLDLEVCFNYASLIHGLMEVKIECVDEGDKYNEECKALNDSIIKKLQQYVASVKSKPLDIYQRSSSFNIADLIYAVLSSENYAVSSVRNNFGENLKNLKSFERFICELLNENIVVPVELKNTEDESDKEKNVRNY